MVRALYEIKKISDPDTFDGIYFITRFIAASIYEHSSQIYLLGKLFSVCEKVEHYKYFLEPFL